MYLYKIIFDGTHSFVPTYHAVFASGSILLAYPPSLPPPIKPDDNQPVVRPAEESPPASLDSSRSFGDSQAATALVTSDLKSTFTATGAPGKGQLQPSHNRPFPDLHSCGLEDDEGMDIKSRDQDSEVSELLEGEGIINNIVHTDDLE